MAPRKYKILVLGANGFNANNEQAMLVSCGWGDLSRAPNPGDFDTVVVCCFDNQPDEIEWGSLPNLLNSKTVRDILFHGGQIIVVGDPRFDVFAPVELSERFEVVPFLTWTGLDLLWHESGGDTVHLNLKTEKSSQKYSSYLSALKRWNYSLQSCALEDEAKYTDKSIYETIEVNALAFNRYRHALAFEVTLNQMQNTMDYGNLIPKKLASGKLTFLPPISLNAEDTVQVVLRDLCGFSAASPELEWLETIIAPGQGEIDKQISDTIEKIGVLNDALAVLQHHRAEKRLCLKLLYEGELILEPIVWSVLQNLGAHIEEPIEKNKEDGWITVEAGGQKFEGVLEIKSTKSDSLGEDGRKQLLDWIQRGIELRGKLYKGIFIGSSALSRAPNTRPLPFSDNWKTSAQLNKICALTTVDLFAAYEAHAAGALNVEAFWKAIFECNGVFSFSDFMKGK